MDSNRKYSFNLPWPAVAIGTGFYVGLALFMADLARHHVGAIYPCLIALSVAFAVLAVVMMTRRLIFPRVLELTDDAILLPRGFPTTKIVRINYADIIRVSDEENQGHNRLYLTTAKGGVEIMGGHFSDIEAYLAARDFICSKASITIARHEKRLGGRLRRWAAGPEPILSWTEPTEWVRYRRAIYTSKPLFLRVGRILRYFICCFGVTVLPWLLLNLCGVAATPSTAYLSLALAVALFFTLIRWMSVSHPVHATKISLCEKGLTQFFGKQTRYFFYEQLSGWAMIERQFEGRGVLILLLQTNTGVRGCALPDINTRDQLMQIFHDKNIQQIPELKPSWED